MKRGGERRRSRRNSHLCATFFAAAGLWHGGVAPAQTSRSTPPVEPVPIPQGFQPADSMLAGACCDDAAESCTEGTSQTSCESLGLRYGGEGSTCATMDPPCRCADVEECPVCTEKLGEGTRRVTIGLIDVRIEATDTVFTYQICRDAESQQLSNWVLGMSQLCCQRIVAVTSNVGTSAGTCERDPVSGLFGLKWEVPNGVPVCNNDLGCGETDDPSGPALFSVMLSGDVATGCVKAVNKIDGPPAEAFACIQGPECGEAFCGDDQINTPGETCDGLAPSDCVQPCRTPGSIDECTCCGDGLLQPDSDETCDPPGSIPSGGVNLCRDDCTYCGDGIVQPDADEECEPPDTETCSADCTVRPFCGDGIRNGDEECDGDDLGDCIFGCEPDCTCTPVCGDNEIDPPDETCDGTAPSDCVGPCREPGTPDECTCCGDGIVQPDAGEECEPPDTETCDSTCLSITAECGDNEVNTPRETCDGLDDFVCEVPGTCREPGTPDKCTCCGDGLLQPGSGETCDPPGSFPDDGPNACRNDCTYCGDGIRDAVEECDGNDLGNCLGGCEPDCTCTPFCGDGVRNNNEECDGDDLGQCPPDAECTDQCICAFCGNNVIDRQQETCDGTDDAVCAVPGSCRDRGDRDECTCCGDGLLQPDSDETCEPPGSIPPGATNPCRDDCTFCGDGLCDREEDACTCPVDCPDVCGDGCCTGQENCDTCFEDCPCPECEQRCVAGVCMSACGDGTCDAQCEDCDNCEADCACTECVEECVAGTCITACGDGVCDAQCEDCDHCEFDCACTECAEECVAGTCITACGDGVCDVQCEACDNCEADCACTECAEECVAGTCRTACGDGFCDPRCEDCDSCPADCPECFGACCLKDGSGRCVDNVTRDDCPEPDRKFFPGRLCADVDCRSIPIPTVSQWGVIVMTLLLLTGAKIRFGRRPEPVSHR